ncbi:GatB/YqeY domain-containing protein [Laetiporus sulphureus 93-53]
MSEVKDAMKSKDTVKSTTIRSVLAEVYAADKAPGSDGAVSSSSILAILRKAVRRRASPFMSLADSAAEFEKANRTDLAQKEKQEAELLEVFLPALLSEAEIDRFIREIIAEQPQLTSEPNKKRAAGMLFKTFYSKVDRSLVDTDLVRSRAEALLAEAS